jgi:hypothetical protein
MEMRFAPVIMVAGTWSVFAHDTIPDAIIRTLFCIGFAACVHRAIEIWRGSV